MQESVSDLKILSVDIGGSHVKATILNKEGQLQMDYERVDTPSPSNPSNLLITIKNLAKRLPGYDRVSVGFPGYVKNGVIITAPNLGTDFWKNVDLKKMLEGELGKPVGVVNDADMQGLGVVSGKGFEMVVTLGTGFGTAVLQDGYLLPHLELAHHPIAKKSTYDDYIGEKAFVKIGKEKWNKRMKKVLSVLKTVFNYDYLYIGGGNAKNLNFPLESNMKIISNKDGIKGGARLWLKKDSTPVITAVNTVNTAENKLSEAQKD
ncbi:MAG: ROK family protein [Segetibacter sp.]